MDFYALLGVSRAASRPELERAYRRLQRRYHPGVNPGDRVAETMYRQIQDAFDVLADEERRRQYDRGQLAPASAVEPVVAFDGFDFTTPADGPLAATFSELFSDVFAEAAREAVTPTRGEDIAITVQVPFIDAMRGGRVPVSITRLERCGACEGSGEVARSATLCPSCRGDGARRWARGHMVFSKACDRCQGTGQTAAEVCRFCRGAGVGSRSEVVTLALPAGLDSGARVTVPGRGHAGARGGPTGDLYVTVDVGEHRLFRRMGQELHLTVPVTVDEAALGADVEVPTLDGTVTVRVPPGSGSGRQLRVVGHGVPAAGAGQAGDLMLTVSVTLPPTLDDRSIALLREFGALNQFDVRKDLSNG